MPLPFSLSFFVSFWFVKQGQKQKEGEDKKKISLFF